tara:strand:+ start:853 stop:1971 length:1119 start_codon:yes stop_codon:yes gene_type:complete
MADTSPEERAQAMMNVDQGYLAEWAQKLGMGTAVDAELKKKLETKLGELTEEKYKEGLANKESAKAAEKAAGEKTKSYLKEQMKKVSRTTDDGRTVITSPGMAHPFAGNYPAEMPSEGTKDYITFSAYSNGVAGYTKAQTISDGAAGNLELEGTVQLYIPENIAVSSKVNYKNTDGSNTATGGNLLGGTGDDDFLGGNGQINNLLSQISGQVVGAIGESGAVAAQISADNNTGLAMGVGAANRHVLFEGVDFREFTYKYEFLPKSWPESVMLRDIIKFFRIQMLPMVKANGNTFKPPHYFTIEYIIDGKPSNYLHKIKPCVCTSVDVSFGGNGQFAMIQGSPWQEPAPALINLDLSFQEVQLVSKLDAALGY